MISEESFWTEEKDAPLLNRNADHLTHASAEKAMQRAKGWVDLVEEGSSTEVDMSATCTDEASLRIFKLDAERTFKSPARREAMVDVLKILHSSVQDYHQGLGYIVSFLLLLLPKEETVRLCLNLHRKDKYVPGYWKAAPPAFVRDAKVYQKITAHYFPQVAEHTTKLCVVPEAYAQKWLVGLCIHVLPFRALCDFLEAFFNKGVEFLFQFTQGLIKTIEGDLLAEKDVSKVLAMLRLDASIYADDKTAAGEDKTPGSFFGQIVQEAINFDLSEVSIDALRAEAMEEMKIEEERRKKRDAELDEEDDEITFSDEEDDG
ncbi:unnamed protein product [Vitrella brassicaformis CCMP3155]|uniref:Rab-GAP TBC domain-containing protein n=1 Tax=Vitrella brassicaformis (strain CCMP3155) TaxID=1169540 RepID=A0A0G4GXL6_VITBC|nr:unnamed protein product [Vitrella brassicaformis CCMP3155]|eukprot:CEM35592.1 unnamed protein product [Vitrella brassicaformis CCMP3155]